ncbi:MAG: hypothetical protein KJ737_26570 [Proteobacteria bacterium]|nr:hypothetical protein [Pseudomonadota bacterium]
MNLKKTTTLILFAVIIFSKNSLAEDQYGQVDIHGFISQGYLQTDKNNYLAETEDGTFQFNEMGINFTTDVTDRLRLGVQFFARDMGINGNDEIVVDWANADYHWRDWLGVRIGKHKGFSGFFSATRDLDMLRTCILLPQSTYGELFRDAFSSYRGVEFYGRILLGRAGLLAYEFSVGEPNFSPDTGIAYAFKQAFSILNLEINNVKPSTTQAYRVTWYAPLAGFKIKSGWIEGKNTLISGSLNSALADRAGLTKFEYEYDFDSYFVSTEYQREKLSLIGEFLSGSMDGKWDLGLGYEDRPPRTFQGWYGALNYDFSEFFKASVSYSEFYPDVDNRHGKDVNPVTDYNTRLLLSNRKVFGNDFEAWLKTTTLSLRFDVNEYWLLKLEVAYNDGFGAYTSAENPRKPDDPFVADVDRYWFLYAAKVTYTF